MRVAMRLLLVFLGLAGTALAWPHHHHECAHCGYHMLKHLRLACCNKGFYKESCCSVYVIPNTPAYAGEFIPPPPPPFGGNYGPQLGPFNNPGRGGYRRPNGNGFTIVQTQFNQQEIHSQFGELGAAVGVKPQRPVDDTERIVDEPERNSDRNERLVDESSSGAPPDYDYINDQPYENEGKPREQKTLNNRGGKKDTRKNEKITFPFDDLDMMTADGLEARRLH